MALNQKSFGDIITFTRASAATRINSLGVMESVAANVPRIDYDPITLAVKGLLIEEQRTNYVRNSVMAGAAVGVIGSGGATPTNMSISAGAGWTMTAEVIGFGSDGGIPYVDYRLQSASVGANNYFTLMVDSSWPTLPIAQNGVISCSAYMKLVSGSAPSSFTFKAAELASGTSIKQDASATIAVQAGAIRRYTGSIVATDASVTHFAQPSIVFSPPAGSAFDFTIRVGGLQVEIGAFSTSLIPTTGAQATRAADVANINTISPWYNSAEGSLYVEFVRPAIVTPDSVNRIVAQLAGISGNHMGIVTGAASGANHRFDVVVGGTAQAQINATNSYVAGAVAKIAAAYKQDSFAAIHSGGSILEDSSGSIPAVSSLKIGVNAGVDAINGYLRKIRYFPKRLTNAELQALTA